VRRLRAFWLVSVVVALSAVIAACSSSPSAPTAEAYSQTDLKVGTGTEALTTSTVTVNYTGWFYDASKADKKGLQFDTSTGRPEFTVALGAGTVIIGWEQGIPGMRVGGQRRLVLPPSMAYGSARWGVIPPNATLIFDIELVKVQ
jgi:FKBP-type peptidyl-prolyl cis-trans isomerase FkpA